MSSEYGYQIPLEFIANENGALAGDLERDCECLQEGLRRWGLLARADTDLERLAEQVSRLDVAIPIWGLSLEKAAGGRFSIPGLPGDIFEALVDASALHRLAGTARGLVLRLPENRLDDPHRLLDFAKPLGLGFDAVDPDISRDPPGQAWSYRFGALGHTDPQIRALAVTLCLECLETGKALGAEALAVSLEGIADSAGRVHFRRCLDRTIGGLREVHEALPESWRMFIQTTVQDWGTASFAAAALGEKAQCLLDPAAIPGIAPAEAVARMVQAAKLGGLCLGTGSAPAGGLPGPFTLFLAFLEIMDAESDREVDKKFFRPTFRLLPGRSDGLQRDPIEDFLQALDEVWKAWARALLVDRSALATCQGRNDAAGAELILKAAFDTDVRPIVRRARLLKGAAIDPVGAWRRSRYRDEKARERKGNGHREGGR